MGNNRIGMIDVIALVIAMLAAIQSAMRLAMFYRSRRAA